MQELMKQRSVHATIRKKLKFKADKEKIEEELKYIERMK